MTAVMNKTLHTVGVLLLGSAFAGLAHATQTIDVEQIGVAPLSDEDMGTQRGRGAHEIINIDEIDMQLNNINETAQLDHNVVYNSNTGDNSVSHDAFAGATGFATVIQNSGNNVIIQNATIVNLMMQK